MKKLKLKKWVITCVYMMFIGILTTGLIYVNNLIKSTDNEQSVTTVSEEIVTNNNVEPVVETTNETVNHPYLLESVTEAKKYYDSQKSEEEQINSLIYYKNTYMQNTGSLYTSNDPFEVVSVLDGTVTSIVTDEILGNVVEITHSTELITVYHCLSDVKVQVGDAVKQNDVIGTSGPVNIDEGYQNSLLFEVNLNGQLINPQDFYNMKVSDLYNN